jgi:outer membrane protein assembly factor BamB
MNARISALAALVTLTLATAAHAVGTRYFSLDSASVLSDGKLEGTAVLSTGSIVASVKPQRIALDSTQIARSVLVQKDGSAFIGTGNGGKIWKLTGDVAKVIAETDALVVTSLAMDAAGTLYAGTLPKGKVFAIDNAASVGGQAPVKARELIALPGAEHVAALALDAKKKLLYAATGPEGKVFALQLGGKAAPKADVFYDGDASHIMSLALADDGTLYAGTSDEALLVKLTAPGRAEVVFDFEGNELTAIALQGSQIAVAANNFPKPAAAVKKPDAKDDKKSEDKTEAPKDDQKPGKGQLWVVTPGARSRKLWSSEQGHLTALQWAEGSAPAIYAATGKEGQIHRVELDGRSALWLDVDERQVLALDLRAPHPVFVTADAGAAYRVLPKGSGDAMWTSKVLDAQFLSRFGELSFRGRGALELQTRSGNTDKPNASWSEWSSALVKPGPIRSPAARFLQIRAKLNVAKDPGSELYAVTAYYLPLNQGGQVTEVTAKPKVKEGSSEPTSVYTLEWKVDNPDGDKLRYRLSFRPEGEQRGRAILRESDILTKTSYDWETESIPDGYYRVAVEASDELESPADGAIKITLESEPFLVDNKKPSVDGLKLEQGKLRGVARDVPGPVTKLERAIDNGDYEPFYPADDLLDTSEEPFAVQLPKLEPGRHVISIRATDARNNRGSAELWITVP